MKIFWFGVAAILILYVVYEYIRMSALVKVSSGLISEARPYERATGTRSVLVLGDSTAVGVGSPSDQTVAGRLGAYLNSSVENYAKSGAVIEDLTDQISKAKKEQYDVVLIQIGANDAIRFHSLEATQKHLQGALAAASARSPRIVVLTAGKIGAAPFFPRILGPIWTLRAKALRARFMTTTAQNGAVYVDLYPLKDPFASDPDRYYAPDGLHLTSDGYEFWFEQVQRTIEKRWPEFVEEL